MDILNFISWIRNKRIVTSVSDNTLIPVGIPDSRRDDKYLSAAIKKSDLIANTSEYTETIINISSAQILAMGSSPVELLPAAGVGKYYDISNILVEYTYNTTPYTFDAGNDTISIYNYSWSVDGYMICESYNTACKATNATRKGDGSEKFVTTTNIPILDFPVEMTTWNSNNPTLGDGTLRVKIYHKTITFGA